MTTPLMDRHRKRTPCRCPACEAMQPSPILERIDCRKWSEHQFHHRLTPRGWVCDACLEGSSRG